MKALVEKRNALIEEMESLVSTAKVETRAFTDVEVSKLEEIKLEIANIDKTIEIENEVRKMDKTVETKQDQQTEQRSLDEQNFIKFIRGEQRALSVASNGGIIPAHIANKIIEKVKELSPIYRLATVYNVGGDLVFPVYDETTSSIGAAYVEDLTELTEGTGKFTTVKLENFIVGSLAKISKSLMNRTDFDLLNHVINKVASAIAEFLEKELIIGETKLQGLVTTTNVVETVAAGKIGVDDLIDAQMAVPQVYQADAVWIMHKNTLKSLRKLKDTTGEYLLNKDVTSPFGWSLLGKHVYLSDNAPQVVAEAKAVFYGDMSGLYVKLAQNVELQVLNEKYATQHAIGVVGYVEADSAVVENQKIVAIEVTAE